MNPKEIPLASLDANQLARAAVVVGSCLADDGVDRYAAHWWSSTGGVRPVWARYYLQSACLAGANCGCDAARQCLGWQVEKLSTCTTGCMGSTFTGCGAGFDLPPGSAASFDCARVGLECQNFSFCADETTPSCDEATFTRSCSADGRPEMCVNGAVRHGPICADLGFDCVSGACVGRGASCTGSISPSPEGDLDLIGTGCKAGALEACVGGALATIDCSTTGPGFSCQQVGSTFFCGLAAECQPATNGSRSMSDPPSCQGTILSFCNAGRLEHVDCVELGFTGCGQDGQGHCTPSYETP